MEEPHLEARGAEISLGPETLIARREMRMA